MKHFLEYTDTEGHKVLLDAELICGLHEGKQDKATKNYDPNVTLVMLRNGNVVTVAELYSKVKEELFTTILRRAKNH